MWFRIVCSAAIASLNGLVAFEMAQNWVTFPFLNWRFIDVATDATEQTERKWKRGGKKSFGLVLCLSIRKLAKSSTVTACIMLLCITNYVVRCRHSGFLCCCFFNLCTPSVTCYSSSENAPIYIHGHCVESVDLDRGIVVLYMRMAWHFFV